MANLATLADVLDRLGRDLADDEISRVEGLLADASAAVRLYTGQDFTRSERTVRLRPNGKAITLTQRPVASVSTVADVEGNDVPFQWDGLDRVYVWPSVFEWERNFPVCLPTVVDVTYTGGTVAVPAAIKAVVVQMVTRALGVKADEAGLQQESIAGYSHAFGAAAAAGGVGLMNDERAVLDKYRRVGGVSWTSV